MQPSESNARYILELERNALLQEKYGFDEKYGTFSFAFLTSLEAFALLAYLYIATVLIYYKKTRTKTNFIVSVWAIINFTALFEKWSREFGALIGDDFPMSEDAAFISPMISGLGRFYGTSLSIVWLFSKYFGIPKPKYNAFLYFLMSLPAVITLAYIYYYFAVNRFIFEVYGPGCDVINTAVYLVVGFIFILFKIFVNTSRESSAYPLMISIVNLITNFPMSLMTIYLRFNLDISWEYRFHMYFVDFFINAFCVSNAFAVLLIIILYNEDVKRNFFGNKTKKAHEVCPEFTKIPNDCDEIIYSI